MSMPHATSYGLDWPFTPKRREKKPAASSRRRSHRQIAVEVAVDQLKVGAAHTSTADLDEHFRRPDIGDGDLLQNQRLPVAVHPRGAHLRHGRTVYCVADLDGTV